jgi:hypothetical protein
LLRIGPVSELTRQPETELLFTLQAPEAAIRTALADREILRLDPLGPQQFNVWLRLPDQSEVDRTIDQLRRAGLSIVAVMPRVQTLEEAFLDIIRTARRTP